MPIGKVKWYDPDRGFGFISNPDGEDCYVSKTVLPHGVTELHRGQRVDFDFASGARGPQALRIKILDEPQQYENVYLNAYETGSEARTGIGRWIDFYNQTRLGMSRRSVFICREDL